MSAVHPIEVLEKRLRDLLEQYESELGDAVDRVTERFSGKIERLVEQFGARNSKSTSSITQSHSYPKTCRSLWSRLMPKAGRRVGIMAKGLKESLKQARKDASRQVLVQIAAVIETRRDLTYKQIAEHFGCGTGLVCQAAKDAGLSRPRGGASPSFRKATK